MMNEQTGDLVFLVSSGFLALELFSLVVSQWLQQQPWFQRHVMSYLTRGEG